jgi:hypothetical protein
MAQAEHVDVLVLGGGRGALYLRGTLAHKVAVTTGRPKASQHRSPASHTDEPEAVPRDRRMTLRLTRKCLGNAGTQI